MNFPAMFTVVDTILGTENFILIHYIDYGYPETEVNVILERGSCDRKNDWMNGINLMPSSMHPKCSFRLSITLSHLAAKPELPREKLLSFINGLDPVKLKVRMFTISTDQQRMKSWKLDVKAMRLHCQIEFLDHNSTAMYYGTEFVSFFTAGEMARIKKAAEIT